MVNLPMAPSPGANVPPEFTATGPLIVPAPPSDAPPEAVKVSATGPGATSDVVPNGIAATAPGGVLACAGTLSTARAFGTLVGASAVPLVPTADIAEAVKLAVFVVWAATAAPSSL
jgi:hypothetical protein